MEVYKHTKLFGKMHLVTKTISSGLSTISMYAKAGSVHENKKNNGISHFLEHLFIGSLDLKDANVNGHTTKEMTSYIFEQQNVNLAKNLQKVLLNWKNPAFLQRSIFENIQRLELKNIAKEIKDTKNSAIDYKVEKHHKIFRSSGSKLEKSLSLPILGNYNTISNLSHSELHKFYKHYYKPQNMLFVIESEFEHKEVVSMFESMLAGHRINTIVGGFENFDYLKFLIIKEMFNLHAMDCYYLPYKAKGLLSYKIKQKKFTEADFSQAKETVRQTLADQNKNGKTMNEEIAYSLLHLDELYSIDSVASKLRNISFEQIRSIYDSL